MASSANDIYNLALHAVGETALVQANDGSFALTTCQLHYPSCLRSMLERFVWPFATTQESLTAAVSEYDATTTYAAAALVRYDGRVYSSVAGSNLGHTPGPDVATYWTSQYVLATGWGYVYTLPTLCVRPVALLAQGERISLLAKKAPFEIQRSHSGEGRIICCDIEPDDLEALEYVSLPPSDGAATPTYDYPPAYSQLFTDALVYLLASRIAVPITKKTDAAIDLLKMHDLYVREAIAAELNGTQADPPLSPSSIRARE